MKSSGLLRLRALRDLTHGGTRYRAGDVLLVEAAEARRLIDFGDAEPTEQALARLNGSAGPWARLATR